MDKKLSIIIPAYNPKRIKTALDSISEQSNLDLTEVIIVDDCSSNKDYLSIMPEYSFDIRVIENETNLKQGLARQVGLDNARGEWVTFMDHDDTLTECCLAVAFENFADDAMVVFLSEIVALDYNWAITQNFEINCTSDTLHAKFFRRGFLQDNDIRFHSELDTQEDSYFMSVVDGILYLDNRYDMEKSIVENKTAGYIWYLWEDSTSHQFNSNGNSYLETSFPNYVKAGVLANTLLKDRYHNEVAIRTKLAHIFLYSYWMINSFIAVNPNNYIKSNIEPVKELWKMFVSEVSISEEDLIHEILNAHDIYASTVQGIQKITGTIYIPRYSVREFIDICQHE